VRDIDNTGCVFRRAKMDLFIDRLE